MKNKRSFVSIEEAKRLIDPSFGDNSDKVIDAKWKAHWKNAKEAGQEEFLMNLLKNHVRLYDGRPSGSGFICKADHSKERTELIDFIINRLVKEFQVDFSNEVPSFLEQYMKDKVLDIATAVRKEMAEEWDNDLAGHCIEASDEIVKRLDMCNIGINAVTVEGWCRFDDESYGSDRPWDPHTWVEIPALGLYVDVTADQFNYGMWAENEFPEVIIQKGLPYGMRYEEPSWDEFEWNKESEMTLDDLIAGAKQQKIEGTKVHYNELSKATER